VLICLVRKIEKPGSVYPSIQGGGGSQRCPFTHSKSGQSENCIILELFLHPLRKVRLLEVHPGKWRLLEVFMYPVRKVENLERC